MTGHGPGLEVFGNGQPICSHTGSCGTRPDNLSGTSRTSREAYVRICEGARGGAIPPGYSALDQKEVVFVEVPGRGFILSDPETVSQFK